MERGSGRVTDRGEDNGSGGQREERFDDVFLLVLKMEEGATSQGKQEATRRCIEKGNGFSSSSSRREAELDLTHFGLLTFRTMRESIYVAFTHKMCGNLLQQQ